MGGFAWVTLATNDSYSLGALVLAHSLRRVNTAHQLVVLITPGVTQAMRTQLSAVFNLVKLVDVLDSKDVANLSLLARPELGITFTKLHCWKLTQFDKCVFLDADTLVLQNSDELFEREELSAAPDAGWPDCFNSGVFVYKPNDDTFNALIDFAMIHGSFDGGDQGLLNLFFSEWPTKDIKKHLPFVYNMCSTATYSYLPAFKQFGHGLKIVHFIGAAKPWLQPFNSETGLASVSGESQHVVQFVQLWWDLFCTHVHSSLSTDMAGLAAALSTVTLGSPLSAEHSALQEHLRRQGWEQGNIDYMGKDSFANIWQKICQTLASGPQPRAPASPETSAPVAPVAAPVYVSSVEISPTGPIDTSPPANYAPVSPPKPVAESKAATAAAEPATEKSASVTEIVPSESAPPAAVDTPAQPSTEKVPDPVPTTTPAPAPAPARTQEISLTTSAPIATPPETIPPPVLPATPVSTAPAPALPTGGTAIPLGQTPLATETPVPPTQTQPPIPVPATVDTQLPAPIPAPVSAPSPAAALEPPVPVTSSLEILTPQAPAETPIPSLPVQTPTEAPVCPVPLAMVPVPETLPTPLTPAPEPALPTPLAPLPALPQSPALPIAIPPPSATLVQAEATALQPAQPVTPSITEPTPPTSPQVAPQEPSLGKLHTDTEIPATPPAGASAADPSEPPVPPKRKGGSKAAQEAKAPKGKPAKGKK